MEKFVDKKSPLTGGRVKEIESIEEHTFRKEKYRVRVRYYVCEDTGEEFTSTEQDTLFCNDLYSQYRIRKGIPFPEEIKEIRQKYGLNYSQISRILGFGVNQYASYEAGEVPSESNGKMIAAIRDKNVLLNILKGCKDSFTPTEYNRIYASINNDENREDEFSPLYQIVYTDRNRSIFNGYGYKNIPKLFEMVRYIVSKNGEVFPIKLNKLMFYSDFYHYRKMGLSISGLEYRAMNFGPVPDHYATIYDNVPNLDKTEVERHDMTATLYDCHEEGECNLLSEDEKKTIDYVIDKLKPLSTSQIIELSQEEKGWQDNSTEQNLISYDEAFDLKLL